MKRRRNQPQGVKKCFVRNSRKPKQGTLPTHPRKRTPTERNDGNSHPFLTLGSAETSTSLPTTSTTPGGSMSSSWSSADRPSERDGLVPCLEWLLPALCLLRPCARTCTEIEVRHLQMIALRGFPFGQAFLPLPMCEGEGWSRSPAITRSSHCVLCPGNIAILDRLC